METGMEFGKVQEFAQRDGWKIATLENEKTDDRPKWKKIIKGDAWLWLVSKKVRFEERIGDACAVSIMRVYFEDEKLSLLIEAREIIKMLDALPYATDKTWVNPGLLGLTEGHEDNGKVNFFTMTPNGREDLIISYGIVETGNFVSHTFGAVPSWWVEENLKKRNAE